MSEILDNLNEEEHVVFNTIHSLAGKMEDIENQINFLGLPEKYNEIYRAYSAYYKLSRNIEALKRMIFIQWFGALEPLAFTGIARLDNTLEKETLILLFDLLHNGRVDREFRSMFAHYYNITEWYFDASADFSGWNRTRIMETNAADFTSSFNDRGLMGEYWRSIIER